MDGNHGDIHPKGDDFTPFGIPFVMASDINKSIIDLVGCKFISKEQADGLRKGFSLEGDVLLTHKATIGRTAIVPETQFPYLMLTPQVTYYRVLDKEKLDNRFLKYYFDYKPFQETLGLWAGAGSTRAYLGITGQHNLALRVPDIQCQKGIANVLSAIDAKIQLNNRINAELEAMAKTLYDYWFVQFDFPDANGKPYKSSGGKMVYNPILKWEIPAGWEVTVIADILGKTPPSNKVLNQEINVVGSIPVIDQSQDYICGFTDDMSALIMPTQPHVVFGDHTRAVKLVNFEYARGADGTQILLSNNSRMPGYLLYQAVSDIDLSNYGYARHFKFLKDSKIILPNEAIATRYQQVVTPCYEKIKVGIFENQHLMRLRDWLLSMLMNGQVTII